MPRARMLKPGFFKNEDLAALPYEGRLLFEGLWVLADREGRLKDKPAWIKAETFPYDTLDVDPLLTRLHEARFIVRYRVKNDAYIAVAKFHTHQHPHPKEPPSTIPELPKRAGGRTLARHGPDNGQPTAKQRSTTEQTMNDRAESFPSESFPSGSLGSSGSSDHPSAPLRGASPLKGASPLRGSRRLKRNTAALDRAAEHIRARAKR